MIELFFIFFPRTFLSIGENIGEYLLNFVDTLTCFRERRTLKCRIFEKIEYNICRYFLTPTMTILVKNLNKSGFRQISHAIWRSAFLNKRKNCIILFFLKNVKSFFVIFFK